jgi:hypothetical protein
MKIIRVEPTEKTVSLTWMVGAQCNYDRQLNGYAGS